MALAFLLLQTGFTKGSEDFQFNHRWKMVAKGWWHCNGTSMIGGSHAAPATKQSLMVKTARRQLLTHRTTMSDKGQTRWTESMKRLSHTFIIMQKKKKNLRSDMVPFSAPTSDAHVSIISQLFTPLLSKSTDGRQSVWNRHSSRCAAMIHTRQSKKTKS